MTTHHTPGPWFLNTFNDGSMVIQPRQGFMVCPVKPRDGFTQDAPNFQLMATAPELLETLIAALPYVEMAEHDAAYKPGAVAKMTLQIRNAIHNATNP